MVSPHDFGIGARLCGRLGNVELIPTTAAGSGLVLLVSDAASVQFCFGRRFGLASVDRIALACLAGIVTTLPPTFRYTHIASYASVYAKIRASVRLNFPHYEFELTIATQQSAMCSFSAVAAQAFLFFFSVCVCVASVR